MTSSLFSQVYKETEHSKTKIGQEVFRILNHEDIADIVLEGKTFWFEHYLIHNQVPQSVYDWIVRYLEKKGFKYLHKEGI